MAARRGVFRSGVRGVVGEDVDMADGRHAAEWDVLMAHATEVLYCMVRGVQPGAVW